MNTRGNKIWLGGTIDQDLIYLFPDGIRVWVEEEGDLRLLVFLSMEYERESSRTVCNVVPKCSELGEGVYICLLEIQPL